MFLSRGERDPGCIPDAPGETGLQVTKGISLAQIFNAQSLSHIQLFVSPWTAAHQAPLSMEFSMDIGGYWNGLPLPTAADFPNPGSNQCLLPLMHWQVHLYHCATCAQT